MSREHIKRGSPHVVLQMPWRSQALTDVLIHLDSGYLSLLFHKDGTPAYGIFPKHRRRTLLASQARVDDDSVPVPGLPRNCYDDSWLDSLDDEALHALNIQREVNLKVPGELQRYSDSQNCSNVWYCTWLLFASYFRNKKCCSIKTNCP